MMNLRMRNLDLMGHQVQMGSIDVVPASWNGRMNLKSQMKVLRDIVERKLAQVPGVKVVTVSALAERGQVFLGQLGYEILVALSPGFLQLIANLPSVLKQFNFFFQSIGITIH